MAFVGSRQIWFVQSFRHGSTGYESFLMHPCSVLPSSHCSLSIAFTTESPQNVQSARQTTPGKWPGGVEPGGSQVSGACTTPSPHSGGMQVESGHSSTL